jgi:hypothetical protein
MNILDTIIAHKKIEVAEAKEMLSIKSLESSAYFTTPKISLKNLSFKIINLELLRNLNVNLPLKVLLTTLL